MTRNLEPEEIRIMMDRRTGVSPESLSESTLREAGCMTTVCVLPAEFNERVSYLANVLVQMLTRKPDDAKLRAAVGTLCQSLSYILNSASWREGELHDFDLDELERKLARFARPE